MDIKDNFQSLINSKERMIYVFIYAMVAVVVLTICFASVSFYMTGNFIFNSVYGQRNVKEADRVYEQVKLLHNDEQRLFEIANGVNKLKYPDRVTIREDINRDLSTVEFEVQSFSFKDYIAETKTNTPVKKSNELVEIGVSGKMPLRNLVSLMRMIDRKDRIWSLHTIEINSPDGTSDFFGRSFAEMPQTQKKEYVNTYKETGTPESISVSLTFLTYVRDIDASKQKGNSEVVK